MDSPSADKSPKAGDELLVCSECGVMSEAQVQVCWRCGSPRLSPVPKAGRRQASPLGRRRWSSQFSLIGLLLLMTLLGTNFAILARWPILGTVLLLVVTPAIVRTTYAVRDRGPEEGPLTVGMRAGFFLASVLIAVTAASCGLLTSIATTIALIEISSHLPPGGGLRSDLQGLAALGTGACAYVGCLWWTWPK